MNQIEIRPGMLVQEMGAEGQARIFVVTKLLDQDRYCGHDVFTWDDSLAVEWTQELGRAAEGVCYEVSDNKLWYCENGKRTLCMTLFEIDGIKYCVGSNAQTNDLSSAQLYLPYEEFGTKIRRSMVFFDYNKSTWVLLPSD